MTEAERTTDEKLQDLFLQLRTLPDAPPATRRIAIISTPRSGSKLFCRALADTGRFGQPKEWLNLRYVGAYAQVMQTREVNMPDYLRYVASKTTSANGVFSLNFHIEQYLDWQKRGIDLLTLGFERLYRVYREDRLAQALSLAKARLTDRWSADSKPRHDIATADIPDSAIARALHDLAVQDDAYRQQLAGRVRMEFRYEDFSQSDDCVHRLLEDCGIEHTGLPALAADKKQQRGDEDARRLQAFRGYLGLPG